LCRIAVTIPSVATMLLHDAADFLRLGLELVGFEIKRQTRVRNTKNYERFATYFVASPDTVAVLWKDIQGLLDFDVKRHHVDHFPFSIHFLAKYPTELELEGTFGWCDRTVRQWVWSLWLPCLQALKPTKIVWPEEWPTTFIITVYGIHCPINEPSHGEWSKNPECYSHKFASSGLDYEIGISIFTNKVLWINGPFKAGKHSDIKVFHAGLKSMIPTGKLVIADLGCRGEHLIIATPNSHGIPEVREFKSRALARHKTFDGEIKLFQCLSRHGIHRHQVCFEAVAVIGVYMIENAAPLFDV